MSQALTTLGYADVYRGLNSLGKNDDWIILGNAADVTFPSLPTYRGLESRSRATSGTRFGAPARP
jgi:hypothetical protein